MSVRGLQTVPAGDAVSQERNLFREPQLETMPDIVCQSWLDRAV